MTYVDVETSTGESTNKPISAEKFKTKMCRNFVTKGECPYETRCMFAHGEGEMRTKEMNLRDGLITEEAIRSFRRATAPKNRSLKPKQPHELLQQPAMQWGAPLPQEEPCYCDECMAADNYQQTESQHPRGYTHDPYGWYAVDGCQCADCLVQMLQEQQQQQPPCMCEDCVNQRQNDLYRYDAHHAGYAAAGSEVAYP